MVSMMLIRVLSGCHDNHRKGGQTVSWQRDTTGDQDVHSLREIVGNVYFTYFTLFELFCHRRRVDTQSGVSPSPSC